MYSFTYIPCIHCTFLLRCEGAFLASLLPGHTDFLGRSGGEGVKGVAFGQAYCHTSARPNLAILDPQDPKRKPTTAGEEGYHFAFPASLSPWYQGH